MEEHSNAIKKDLPALVYNYLNCNGYSEIASKFLKMLDQENQNAAIGLQNDNLSIILNEMVKAINNKNKGSKKFQFDRIEQENHDYKLNVAENGIFSTFLLNDTSFLKCLVNNSAENLKSLKLHNRYREISSNYRHSNLRNRALNLLSVHRLVEADEFDTLKRFSLSKRVMGHVTAIYCLCLDQTKTVVFTAGEDGLVKVWNLNKMLLTATLRGHTKAVFDLSVKHDNKLLASGGLDQCVKIWCLKTTEQLHSFKVQNGSIYVVSFSPYPVGLYSYFYTISSDGTICFWKFDENNNLENEYPTKFLDNLSHRSLKVNCCTHSPGGTYIVIAATDPLIRVYKISKKGPLRTMELCGHEGEVESVEFSHKNSSFASGSKDGVLCIWTLSVNSWKHEKIELEDIISVFPKISYDANIHHVQPKKKASLGISLISWSAWNNQICCACTDFTIRNYDLVKQTWISIMIGHTDEITVLQHHLKSNQILFSTGCDALVFIWNTETAEHIMKFSNDLGDLGLSSIYHLSIIHESGTFVFCDNNGNIAKYGTGLKSQYNNVPDSQFFHTDYCEVGTNSEGRLIDLNNETEPHKMPPPLFVNYAGMPYNDEVQCLIPGSSNFVDLTSTLNPDFSTLESTRKIKKFTEIGIRKHSSYANGHSAWFQRIIVPVLSKYDIESCVKKRRVLYYNEQNAAFDSRLKYPDSFNKEERIGRLLHLQSLRKQKQVNQESNLVVTLRNRFQNIHENSELSERSEIASSHDTEELNHIRTVDENISMDASSETENSSYEEAIDITNQPNRSTRLRSLRPRAVSQDRPRSRRPKRRGNVDVDNSSLEVPPQPSNYPSTWTSNDSPNLSQYVPQMNDIVYYYIQGHKLYVQELLNQNMLHLIPNFESPDLLESTLYPSINSAGVELCRVIDVEYIYKNPLVCKVKLERLNDSHRSFFVEFTDLDNSVDFLILKQVYDYFSCIKWTNGTRIKSIIDNRWWEGVIIDSSPYNPEFPESDFFKYTIKWDTGECDRLSPWDMNLLCDSYSSPENSHSLETDIFAGLCKHESETSFVDLNECVINETETNSIAEYTEMKEKNENCENDLLHLNYNQTEFNHTTSNENGKNNNEAKAQKIGVSITKKDIDSYQRRFMSYDSWDEEPYAAVFRISSFLERYINSKNAYFFNEPVDLEEYSDYWTYVPQPMDLSKVLLRLKNFYYRSKAALLFDINLIKLNAMAYNKRSSVVVKSAIACTRTLKSFIEDSNKKADYFHTSSINVSTSKIKEIHNSPIKIKTPRKNYKKNVVVSDEEISASDTPCLLNSNEMMLGWITDAFNLLNHFMCLKDCEPFLDPVSTDEFPDYRSIVSEPTDFNTVLTNLKSGAYINPSGFINEIKRIFTNSKLYNTNSRSKIYSMTMRLSNQFDNKADIFLNKWKNANQSNARVTRSIIKNIYNNFLESQNNDCDVENFDENTNLADTSVFNNNRFLHYQLRRTNMSQTLNNTRRSGLRPRTRELHYAEDNDIDDFANTLPSNLSLSLNSTYNNYPIRHSQRSQQKVRTYFEISDGSTDNLNNVTSRSLNKRCFNESMVDPNSIESIPAQVNCDDETLKLSRRKRKRHLRIKHMHSSDDVDNRFSQITEDLEHGRVLRSRNVNGYADCVKSVDSLSHQSDENLEICDDFSNDLDHKRVTRSSFKSFHSCLNHNVEDDEWSSNQSKPRNQSKKLRKSKRRNNNSLKSVHNSSMVDSVSTNVHSNSYGSKGGKIRQKSNEDSIDINEDHNLEQNSDVFSKRHKNSYSFRKRKLLNLKEDVNSSSEAGSCFEEKQSSKNHSIRTRSSRTINSRKNYINKKGIKKNRNESKSCSDEYFSFNDHVSSEEFTDDEVFENDYTGSD